MLFCVVGGCLPLCILWLPVVMWCILLPIFGCYYYSDACTLWPLLPTWCVDLCCWWPDDVTLMKWSVLCAFLFSAVSLEADLLSVILWLCITIPAVVTICSNGYLYCSLQYVLYFEVGMEVLCAVWYSADVFSVSITCVSVFWSCWFDYSQYCVKYYISSDSHWLSCIEAVFHSFLSLQFILWLIR
jgi:hypothetical protein